MQRIYLPNTDFSEKIILGDREIYHQLIKVLRMKLGDEVVFFDGETLRDYVYKIISIEKKHIEFERQEIGEKNTESKVCMTLYQAVPNKFSKLEYIVQKCSEVGFSQIVFFPSERSQKLVLSENKQKRLNSIMKEAIEQCGRNRLCELNFQQKNIVIPVSSTSSSSVIPASPVIPAKAGINKKVKVPCLSDGFLLSQEGQNTLNIVFHQDLDNTSKPIKDISIKKDQSISLYVGPEGGFSDEEVSVFEQENFQKISLGERILRCETVGVVTGFFLGQNQ